MKTYLSIIWRRRWIIIATTLLVVAVVAGAIQLIPRAFEASATLRLAKGNEHSVDYGDLLYSERLMNTYAEMAKSRPALSAVQSQLGAAISPKIRTEFATNSELITIIASDSDPNIAAQSANLLAQFIINQSERAENGNEYNATLFDEAVPPIQPLSPRLDIGVPLGLLAGLIAGLGLALLFESLDTRLHSTAHIEATTALSTLGSIPKARGWRKIGLLKDDTPEAEAFRYLRTNLFVLGRTMSLRTILITSAEATEGKSTIVANLACAVAQCKRRVVVIDGDLRLPRLHTIFGLPNETGLSSLLRQEADLEAVIHYHSTTGVSVIPSGPPPSHPAELLASPIISKMIDQLSTMFDLVLVDAPSLLAVTDATALALHVDGVLLVISCNRSRQETVIAARDQLQKIKIHPLGVVINRAERQGGYGHYQHAMAHKGQ